jgi:GxxExxY protein
MDIVVERSVIVEIKAVERIVPVHEAQLLSYLKLAECRVGRANELSCSGSKKWP